MHYKLPKDRDQIILFPQLDNWVEADNPVRLFDLLIDKLVSSQPEKFLWKGKSKVGCTSYSPATMLKLLLYGYLNRIAGSRRLENETYRNIELIWLLGDLHPDHWTICSFRRENKEQIRHVTIAFREFLKSEGYISGGTVATDGCKFKAYASKDMLTIKTIEQRLRKLDEKLNEYLDEFQKTDTIEDLKSELEPLEGGEQINSALIDKIADMQARIEKLQMQKEHLEESGKNYLAPNDPDANLVRSRDGMIPGYNIQAVTDGKHKMIAVAEITNETCDVGELKNNIEDLNEQLGIEPDTVEADKGYYNTNHIKDIEEESETTCYIPSTEVSKKEEDKKKGKENTYDRENDQYICSQGKTLKLKQRNHKKRNQVYNVYQGTQCGDCLLKGKCTSSKTGRIVKRNIEQDWIDQYKKRINARKAKEQILERKTIVEHPFGSIKLMMGKLHFLLTRKDKVQIEVDLYATAYNFKRLINIENMQLLLQKVDNFDWKETLKRFLFADSNLLAFCSPQFKFLKN